jgi:hypothetical protein
MALLTPLCRMAKNFECPFSAFSPADSKIVREDTNKMSKSQQLITQLNIFGFIFLNLLINLMKMMLLYMVLSPSPSSAN